MIIYHKITDEILKNISHIVVFSKDDAELPLHASSIEWIQYLQDGRGQEQRQRKTSVSKDVNYWLTFVWTLLGMRIRAKSNRCYRRAAWAIEPSSANWWHREEREWVSERQGGRRGPSVSLQVHALSLTQYANSVVHAAAYYYTHCFILPVIHLLQPLCTVPTTNSLNGQLCSLLTQGQETHRSQIPV